MQQSSAPQTWANVFTYLSGILTVVIPLLIKSWVDRKKSSLDNDETSARTELSRLSAQSLALHDNLATGESVGKMLGDLIEAGDTIGELQKRVFRLEQEKIGDDMLRLDLKKALALLAFNNVPFHHAEHPDVKRLIAKLKD